MYILYRWNNRLARACAEFAFVRKTIGEVFKKTREDAGLSLRDVSRLTGMSPSQISQLENGLKPRPEFATVAKLAAGLKISLDAIASTVFGESNTAVQSTLEAREREYAFLLNRIETAKSGMEKIALQLGEALERKPKSRVRRRKPKS